jgi:hypothetical protein
MNFVKTSRSLAVSESTTRINACLSGRCPSCARSVDHCSRMVQETPSSMFHCAFRERQGGRGTAVHHYHLIYAIAVLSPMRRCLTPNERRDDSPSQTTKRRPNNETTAPTTMSGHAPFFMRPSLALCYHRPHPRRQWPHTLTLTSARKSTHCQPSPVRQMARDDKAVAGTEQGEWVRTVAHGAFR